MARSGRRAGPTAAVALLERAEVPYALHEYEHDPAAASFGLEAAAALGRDPEQVLKTLLVVHDRDWAVAVLPVSARLSLRAAAAALGWKRAALADPRLAERRTGYVVGGISPLGQKTPSPLLLDDPARALPTVLVSGGRRGLELELAPEDLLGLTGGRTAALQA
ncbi:Cys-tRNA(Pro)/Cys-tRNA(Cys) deacylase [Kocuria dechangensis]|uniref:Cys-tRNA(Pro)/Cys-tRNA(Cys) deacylase n=1 Tax=Kocuria dechangensis TaxID=1176249 RepID=A0A917GT56_9MICC|nr:Cys-tRNA(Pro) deacylase [Kocuria dechangensis]GGG56252.1 Cys-tRNA(Pro)/Cys-tRNA(Cys) deacylase [Kocuria dechangensis]